MHRNVFNGIIERKIWYLCLWKNALICISLFNIAVKLINAAAFHIVRGGRIIFAIKCIRNNSFKTKKISIMQ